MDTLVLEARAISWRYNGDWLRIEAHGPDGLRLRASPFPDRGATPGALLDDIADGASGPIVTRDGATARITHGRITAEVDLQGRIRFLNQRGELLLEEKEQCF